MNLGANVQRRFGSVADVSIDERAQFIQKTYTHLAVAILAFIGLEALLLKMPFAHALVSTMIGSRFGWLFILIGFIVAANIAEKWAKSDTSKEMQYLGLGLYIVIEAIIFLPLLYIAANAFPPEAQIIQKAGVVTMGLFLGISIVGFISKRDFTFLGSFLRLGFILAFFYIIAGMIFGFAFSDAFCMIMVLLASGTILYQTSNILYYYRTDQHVAAALDLFASVALLFWYILQLFMRSR